MSRVPKPATVAAYVAQVDAPLRPLFRATRAFVRKYAPDLTERHVKVRSKADLSPALARLLREAVGGNEA